MAPKHYRSHINAKSQHNDEELKSGINKGSRGYSLLSVKTPFLWFKNCIGKSLLHTIRKIQVR